MMEVFLQWDDDGLAIGALRREAGLPELALDRFHELERDRIAGARGLLPQQDVPVRAQIQRRVAASQLLWQFSSPRKQ